MTALAARIVQLSEGLKVHSRSLMPPQPPHSRMQTELGSSPYLPGTIPDPFYYWTAELRFRDTLLKKGFDERCENLYYCSLCGVLFVVGEKEFATLDNLEQFVYRYPSLAKHNFCELQGAVWQVRGATFFSSLPQDRLLLAMGYGPTGVYIAREYRWTETWKAMDSNHRISGMRNAEDALSAKCAICSGNYQQMISELQAAGWSKLAEQGKHWYQTRFILPREHRLDAGSIVAQQQRL